MAQTGSGQGLTVGSCRFDQSRGLLLRDGEAVFLRPKAFALLTHLATNAGKVVSKSDLIAAVWPGVFVTEDSLTQAVRELRKALADDSQRIIRTVARRGYLLSPPDTQPETSRSQPTLAVLRFDNEGEPSDKIVVDGLTEDLLNSLARFRRVVVLARNSSFSFASDVDMDWRTVGKQLGADFLVRGAMRLVEGALHVKVILVDAETSAVLWSEAFSATGTAIFSVQEEVAQKVCNRLVARIDGANIERSAAKPPASLDAYEMFLRGLARLRGYREEDNVAAKHFFEQAAARDPDYALAHAYIALADLAIAGYGEAPADVIAKAVERADFAVMLASEEPRCHRVLSMTRLFGREHEAAEYHLRRSLDLNPYDADTMAQMGYLLTMRGKPVEALAAFDRAARINPIHPDWYHYDRSHALYSVGDYQGSLDSLSKLSANTPWRLTRLAACNAQLGNQEQARRLIGEIRRIAPDFSPIEFVRRAVVFEHQADTDHLTEGVTKALAA